MTARRRLLVVSLLLAVAVSCDNGQDPVVPDGASVAVSGGSGQTAVVGTAAATPLSVVVTDVAGAPLNGIPVTWRVVSGAGSVSSSSTTDGTGTASATYTAGTTTGPKVISATVPGATGSPIAFTVTALPGAPKRLVKTAGDGQVGIANQALPLPLTVTAVDTFGNGVPGVNVTWSAASGAALFNPPASVTGADGLASTIATLGAAPGSSTLSANAGALVGSPVLFQASAGNGVQFVTQVPISATYVHDQFVRGGFVFVCAWDAGVRIYDVGGGTSGGSPSNPVLVGSIVTAANGVSGGAQVHNAWWYWSPSGPKRYVFVGQEGPASGGIGVGSSGDIHVVDITNMANPVEVAYYHMSGLGAPRDSAGTHNFWVDEQNEILYAAYYNGGVVAINISGTLTGNLAARELARVRPGGVGNTYIWGVQQYNGSLYATDMLSGFWQLKLVSGAFQILGGGNNVSDRYGSDQWVANGFAYSGTWGNRAGHVGNALKIWQLNGAGAPVLVDSIITAGVGTVSDVEVSADNRMLMFSAEGGPSGGVYFYSLVASPSHPTFIAYYPVGTGLHTATFAELGGHRYVFAARNPGSPAEIILDVTAIKP